MGTKKTIYLIASLGLGLILAITFWPESPVQEIPQESSISTPDVEAPAADIEEVAEEALALAEPELPDAPMGNRTSSSMGENESRNIRQRLISEKPFPKDVAMDQYKSRLWQDLQEDPPPLVPHDSPEVDAELAYRLYMYYGNCSVAPRTQHELDTRINQITARTANATDEYMERVERSAERTFDFFEFCSAIPEDVDARLEAVMWMSDAVYLGHPIAEAQFYQKAMGFLLRPNRFTNGPPIAMLHSGIIEEFKSTSRYALQRAVDRGHPEAFIAMSQAYLDDIIFPRDPVVAMAYVRVAEMAAMESRALDSRIGRQKTTVFPLLTPDEVAEANELASRIHLGEFGG